MPVYLNSPIMLGNYLQQTTSADDIFRCIFLGALRVNYYIFQNVPAGTSIRFEPGEERSVDLVEIAGNR